MKTVILLHGTCDKKEYFSDKYPSLSNSHWFPWLQKQLLIKGIPTQTPEMPDAYKPNYLIWKKELERFHIDKDTTIVGHSCGGGFIIRWLTENKIRIDKLILVAPWMDPSRCVTTDFFDFQIDREIQDRAKSLHVLVSDDEDTEGVIETVEIITKTLPKTKVHKFCKMGHFTFGEMKTACPARGGDKFPELLDIVTS